MYKNIIIIIIIYFFFGGGGIFCSAHNAMDAWGRYKYIQVASAWFAF